MKNSIIPFDRYPSLPPLFLDFLKGSPLYPDRPTLEAAQKRGKELLGQKSALAASDFRWRHPEAEKMAQDLAEGRAVAVVAGHQVGLFTGPQYTVTKAFDAIRVARELRDRGLHAVPVFFALTDDHDLEEVARTARPGPEGPETLVLEGADRANRRPVGPLPIPERITEIVERFRPDARTPEASEILEAFARRSAPGTTYGNAFIETLLDLVDEPLLVADPLVERGRAAAAELMRRSAGQTEKLRETLASAEEAIRRQNRDVPAPHKPGVFCFFLVADGERRRIEDVPQALRQVSEQHAWVSADVLTRPVLKSFLLPIAASILGPAEIAYHAQSLPLFPLLGVRPPVLMPRSHVVLIGPAERRAAEALGISPQDLLRTRERETTPAPGALRMDSLARHTDRELETLAASLQELDPTLEGALETTRRKVAYQMGQLAERIRKAAERKDEVREKRSRKLETMVRPGGTAAERLYPPLVALLAYGRKSLEIIRSAATGSLEGGVVAEIDGAAEEKPEGAHAG
ncbi:MAG TPA: bacillithiol biosynthesis BshC [Thermoanaerobaculia bacterium]